VFIPFDAGARVTLAVVSLGTPQRLLDCLASLVAHEAREDFSVVCVVNPASHDDSVALDFPFPDGVLVVRESLNVGWPGGLHVARSLIHSELFVWVQEDMVVLDGWLDALVAAADEHPEFAAFGSCSVDAAGRPTGVSFGAADPPHDIRLWRLNPDPSVQVPEGVTRVDWITSKGMLVRLGAWDEVGGANPACYPLNHVDHEFCAHLGAHDLAVAVVSDARVLHLQSQSTPSMFRRFVGEYRDPVFNAVWGPVLAARAAGATTVEHDCMPWFPGETQSSDPLGRIRAVAGAEASLMLIAFAKWSSRFVDAAVEHQKNIDTHELNLLRARLNGRGSVLRTIRHAIARRVLRRPTQR
jgi:GT2 family glycosyltransferase